MVESIIKILSKLKDNIEKYKVTCMYEKNNPTLYCSVSNFNIIAFITYIKDNEKYYIDIYEDKIIFCIDKRGSIEFKYTDDASKYELLKLASEINTNCRDYISTQIRNFADSFDDEID